MWSCHRLVSCFEHLRTLPPHSQDFLCTSDRAGAVDEMESGFGEVWSSRTFCILLTCAKQLKYEHRFFTIWAKTHPGCNFLWQWHRHPDFWIKLVKQKWGEFQPRAAVNRISVIPIMNLKAVLWTLCFHRCYTQKLGLTNLQLITTQLIQFGFCMGVAKWTEIKGGVDVSGTGSVPEGLGIPRGNSICWLQESNRSFLLGFLYLFTGGLDQMNKFQDTARSWWWWTWSCSGKKAGNPKKAHLWPNCADLAAIKSLLAQLQRKKKNLVFSSY